ncbi:MAG TPA: hypothetical protein VJ673_12240 [Aromatoleum sp.]|uniref:DUF7931 domain-containing protein n=1 Tax=Aromatoleum sp. TaxID=2307007 RepID=UPI002B48E4FE|nr:hypothetical protein [Aromatoleum sp.]HJV26448.1 hypothetical protein [Aromatoleum sp.]
MALPIICWGFESAVVPRTLPCICEITAIMDHPSESTFDAFAAYRQAVADVLALAGQTIIVFDPDLGECGFEAPATLALLEAACQRSPRSDALRIVLHDPDFVERDCPRLQRFLCDYGHRASLRISDPGSRSWTQPFIVVDGEHLVARFHPAWPRGKACLAMPSAVTRFSTQFETLWLRGENRAIGSPLGL